MSWKYAIYYALPAVWSIAIIIIRAAQLIFKKESIMKNVKVPFYFYVDMSQESNEELMTAYMEWMAEIKGELNQWLSTEPDKFKLGYKFIGTMNAFNYSRTDRMFGFKQSNDYSDFEAYNSKKITLEFWDKHIRNREYAAISKKEGYRDFGIDSSTIEIVTAKRNQICRAEIGNSDVNKALKDLGYKGKINNLLISNVNRATEVGYYLIGNYDEIDICDYSIPKALLRSLIAKKKVFKCQVSDRYAWSGGLMNFVRRDGTKLKASSYYVGYWRKSEKYKLWFENRTAMNALGYAICEETDDLLPIGEAKEAVNAKYHHMVRDHGYQWKCKKDEKFTIGFEIEKEDAEARKIFYRQLFTRTGWIKESDSSLCSEAGYELVSPVFNLMDSSLEKEIEGDEELKTLINGTYNIRKEDDGSSKESCGGHINIGSSVYSPIQLFYGIKGFLPLLYSIFNLRVDKHYSQARKPHDYTRNMGSNNHTSALQIKDKVVELRIVAAVRNVNNLLWRRDLVRIMVKNINKSEQEVLRLMLNPRSVLHRHLRKVYKSDEKFFKKCNDFVKFSERFNDVKLNDIDWERFNGKTNEQ